MLFAAPEFPAPVIAWLYLCFCSGMALFANAFVLCRGSHRVLNALSPRRRAQDRRLTMYSPAASSRQLLFRLWKAARFFAVAVGFNLTVTNIAVVLHHWTSDVRQRQITTLGTERVQAFSLVEAYAWVAQGLFWVFLGLISTPSRRSKASMVLRRLADRGHQREASLVAMMMGTRDHKETFQRAKQSFRCLPWRALCEADFTSSTDSGMYDKTRVVPLGQCDFFISHSWHDSGEMKWKVFQKTLWDFENNVLFHSKGFDKAEPVVWLDKACIKQTSIEDSLPCLPVYLAGCSRLFVLAGKTYLKRLWCVMELFIFLRMGGEQRHVTIRAVADASSTMAVEPESDRDSSPMARSRKRRERRDASHNDEDDDDIISLNTFDAAEADCFRVDDKEGCSR